MPSADDAERGVSALETKVEMLGGANDAVLGLLRDQARTLNGHTATLAEHSRFHAAHRARFDQIGATLAEHSRFHAAHQARFDQIGATLAEHSGSWRSTARR